MQPSQGIKLPVTEVAFKPVSVPARRCDRSSSGTRVCKKLLRDSVARVTASDFGEDSAVVEIACIGTSTGFEVGADACCSCEGTAAEGTCQV